MIQLKKQFIWIAPFISAILAISLYSMSVAPAVNIVASTTLLCALWWIFEPIPIPITSLIPLTVFTMTGVLSSTQVANAYGHPIILLLLGGFILSQSMAYSGAHRRIALLMVNCFGSSSPKHLIMGFMTAAAVLSMWISNTATTLMLLPVALATVESTNHKGLTTSLLLGIAYAASIGGIGTPIGTPPNALFMSTYNEVTGNSLSFLDWMALAIPLVIIFIPLAMLWITRGLPESLDLQIPKTGQWSAIEKRVLLVFLITAILWITRQQPFGGWSDLTGLTQANDASIALLACISMFIIPDGKSVNGKQGKLLNWESASKIPWGVLLLFAGGICIAKAFAESGLSQIIGAGLTDIVGLPTIILIALIALTVTFLTEMTSNTATTALLMPILAAGAMAADIDPMLLMVPAAMSASCAFMLPVATAPNAIVYGSNHIEIQQMVRKGFVLNLIGIILVSSVCYILI